MFQPSMGGNRCWGATKTFFLAMITPADNGCLLQVEVSTNAKKFEIVGRNEWTGRLKIKLASPPSEGRANKELVEKLSEALSVPVTIVQGLKSHKKTVLLNISEKELKNRLDLHENRAGKA